MINVKKYTWFYIHSHNNTQYSIIGHNLALSARIIKKMSINTNINH